MIRFLALALCFSTAYADEYFVENNGGGSIVFYPTQQCKTIVPVEVSSQLPIFPVIAYDSSLTPRAEGCGYLDPFGGNVIVMWENAKVRTYPLGIVKKREMI